MNHECDKFIDCYTIAINWYRIANGSYIHIWDENYWFVLHLLFIFTFFFPRSNNTHLDNLPVTLEIDMHVDNIDRLRLSKRMRCIWCCASSTMDIVNKYRRLMLSEQWRKQFNKNSWHSMHFVRRTYSIKTDNSKSTQGVHVYQSYYCLHRHGRLIRDVVLSK